jgi:hypothetical protein
MKINATQVNDAVGLLGTVVPQVLIAYNLFKIIWTSTNPGKTEEDFLNYLTAMSQQNIDQSAAILIADGYVQDAAGNWSKKSQ